MLQLSTSPFGSVNKVAGSVVVLRAILGESYDVCVSDCLGLPHCIAEG
jgi:hypothetical protein